MQLPFTRPPGRARIAVALAIALLCLPVGAAHGQSSAQSGYRAPGGRVQADIAAAQRPSAESGSKLAGLPFTGADLIPVFGGGLLLVALGGALRRMTTRRQE